MGAAEIGVPVGTRALSEAHRRALESGAASFESLAAELKVSKQAVHKAFRKRGWLAKSDTPAPAPAASPAGRSDQAPAADAVDGLMSADRAAEIVKRSTLASIQGHLAIISEAQTILTKGKGHLSPVVLHRLQSTIERSSAFINATLLPRESDAEALTELRISIMSREEEAALRKEAELAFGAAFNVADQLDGGPVGGRAAAIPTPAPPPSSRLRIVGGLPGRHNFQPWLVELARQSGARFLRQVGEAVGLKVGAGEDVGLVAERIIHRLDGDPQRLRQHVEIVE